MEERWFPSVHLRWIMKKPRQAALQQLWHCYECNDGMFGAKLKEEWRDVSVLGEEVKTKEE